jgi:hypothetical protein
VNKKAILRKALAEAKVTELEAMVLVMEIFQEVKESAK